MEAAIGPFLEEDERQYLLDYITDLRKGQIREFFKQHDVPTSGSKEELRDRLKHELREGNISYSSLISYIDKIAPWDKQHVFLYDGPAALDVKPWSSLTQFKRKLKKLDLEALLDQSLPVVLPKKMTISSIQHTPTCLRVTAVERWDAWEPDKDKDYVKIEKGRKVKYTASVNFASRGLMILEWNLVTNSAWLQISQVPAKARTYDDARKAFLALVRTWIPLEYFTLVDMRKAISYFHMKERQNEPETRSHKLAYTMPSGHRLEGRSAMAQQPVLDNRVIDDALSAARENGVGHSGNFYFLPDSDNSANPLSEELHIYLLANQRRVNFPTAQSEEVIRYVLQRIQAACGGSPRT